MSEQTQTAQPEQSNMPEGLVNRRVIGEVPSSALPWLDEKDQIGVSISEAEFADGKIYFASAVSHKVKDLSDHVRANDADNKLREMEVTAAHLEANGGAITSDHIKLVKGVSGDYSGFAVKAFREGKKPNSRRIYYAFTSLSRLEGFQSSADSGEVDSEQNVLIRLGYADKQNQLEFLSKLTGRSRKQLRSGGAGAI